MSSTPSIDPDWRGLLCLRRFRHKLDPRVARCVCVFVIIIVVVVVVIIFIIFYLCHCMQSWHVHTSDICLVSTSST
jgi:hypothetical protein